FFQADDGIRDRNVTGVQTCALPISVQPASRPTVAKTANANLARIWTSGSRPAQKGPNFWRADQTAREPAIRGPRTRRRQCPVAQIGRAACRGRVRVLGAEGCVKRKG